MMTPNDMARTIFATARCGHCAKFPGHAELLRAAENLRLLYYARQTLVRRNSRADAALAVAKYEALHAFQVFARTAQQHALSHD